MTKKTSAASRKSDQVQRPTIVLYGLDDKQKPRAARFTGASEPLLAIMAQTMGLRLGIPTTDEHFEVVEKLPVGRVSATGTGSVPNIRPELYDRINVLFGVQF